MAFYSAQQVGLGQILIGYIARDDERLRNTDVVNTKLMSTERPYLQPIRHKFDENQAKRQRNTF